MVVRIKDKNLYYVGGVVRDEILGTSSFDTDYCYEGDAIKFAKQFEVIKINPDFGTARVKINNAEVDIASTRIESYPKAGHLPVVAEIGCLLKEDLNRRDFTINAMAKNTVSGEIIDYFGGQYDIKKKQIRILHNNSFIDDPSRILRALKFSVRFGFELEENTKKLQEEYLKNINYDQSYHRLKKELKETFNLNKDLCYKKFIEEGIYKLLGHEQQIPVVNGSIEVLVNKYNPQNVWLVYIGLFDLANFELNNEEKEIIFSYKAIAGQKPVDDCEIYKLFRNKPLESVLLYALSNSIEIAERYLTKLSNITLFINGEDLKKLGFKQGKLFGEILDYVLEKKIAYPEAQKEDEIKWLKARFLK